MFHSLQSIAKNSELAVRLAQLDASLCFFHDLSLRLGKFASRFEMCQKINAEEGWKKVEARGLVQK
jgi:hypothetical protein